MFEDLNQILSYLKTNRLTCSNQRTKLQLRKSNLRESRQLDAYLCKLTKDNYIRLYIHPNVRPQDDLVYESDLKFSCAITGRGLRFIGKGGYKGRKIETETQGNFSRLIST